MEKSKTLVIIHFTDAHEVLEASYEPKGGIARFYTALKKYKKYNPLILFSGDLLSPSQFSPFFKGDYLVESLNKFNIRASCYGNHDFDYQYETLIKLKNRMNFPWLFSNVRDKSTQKIFGEAEEYLVIKHNEMKVGLIGIVEHDWLQSLAIDYSLLDYEDFVQCSLRLVNKLKNEEKCDIVIALTHMRQCNDDILAEKVSDIDIILAGHEHKIYNNIINGIPIIKEKPDYKQIHKITVSKIPLDQKLVERTKSVGHDEIYHYYNCKNYSFKTKLVNINSTDFKPHEKIKAIINSFQEQIQDKMQTIIGFTNIELETRNTFIRKCECNFSNFITDLLRIHFNSDIALINGGSFRSDTVFQKGEFTLGELHKALPYPNQTCSFNISGEQIHQLLENGVSRFPSCQGRFSQISGVKFSFDPSLPSYSRINKKDIYINNQEINYEKIYKISTLDFLVGKDGYIALVGCPQIDVPIQLQNLVLEFFSLLENKEFMKFYQQKNPLITEQTKIYSQYKTIIQEIKEFKSQNYIVINPSIEERIKNLQQK